MKDIIASKWIRWVVGALALAVVFFLGFGSGVSVGYQKAIFASEWGKNYEVNFSGPQARGIMPEMAGGDAHGAAGTIISISNAAFSVKNENNDEQSVVMASDTVIKEMDATISPSKLSVGDHVVVIGMPNVEGQVEAHFIRVLPAPEPGGGPRS
jgi:hypothetical protein